MKLPGHLISFAEWMEFEDYGNYVFDDEKGIEVYDAYKDTPSKEACDKLSAAKSGKVIRYYI